MFGDFGLKNGLIVFDEFGFVVGLIFIFCSNVLLSFLFFKVIVVEFFGVLLLLFLLMVIFFWKFWVIVLIILFGRLKFNDFGFGIFFLLVVILFEAEDLIRILFVVGLIFSYF